MSEASVQVEELTCGRIGRGFLVLLGVRAGDGENEARWIAKKIAGLRVFPDSNDKMNLSLADVGGGVLLVSQFTLYGNTNKGNRPSFVDAAPPEEAKRLYELVAEELRGRHVPVETGKFGAVMRVGLVNEGPVTLLLRRETGEDSE